VGWWSGQYLLRKIGPPRQSGVSADCSAGMPYTFRTVYLLLRIGLSDAFLLRAEPASADGPNAVGERNARRRSATLEPAGRRLLGGQGAEVRRGVAVMGRVLEGSGDRD